MVAEVVHGAPCRFSDPARFSLALGGKDRHPFPVPTQVYDETLKVLKSAVHDAKLRREEALGAIQRLDEQARRLEKGGDRKAGMIVKLIRPDGEHAGPWLLVGEPNIITLIEPGPELPDLRKGESGYFHAERTGDGWDIGEKAPDQPW